MLHALLLPLVLTVSVPAEKPDAEKFIVMSEFQIWADPVGPETYRALNKMYLKGGYCHSFKLYQRGKGYDYFIWDQERTKYWVNECVALFAGLMPVPGGVGVTEAALTAGFTAIGVDSATAMAAAITYRLVTFYLPPCVGYFTLRSLRAQQFL